MHEPEDNYSLTPSALDMERLDQLQVDGRVEAENRTWVVLRYPASEVKGWKWCEYSLIVNCPGVPPHPAPYEFKNFRSVLCYLEQLEKQRLTSNES